MNGIDDLSSCLACSVACALGGAGVRVRRRGRARRRSAWPARRKAGGAGARAKGGGNRRQPAASQERADDAQGARESRTPRQKKRPTLAPAHRTGRPDDRHRACSGSCPRPRGVVAAVGAVLRAGIALGRAAGRLCLRRSACRAGCSGFLKKRREKQFTDEFAHAIDVIVRSVKSGLPVNEALKVVASEIPEPVGRRVQAPRRKPEGRRHHGRGPEAHVRTHADAGSELLRHRA